jgi:hypothetical protein
LCYLKLVLLWAQFTKIYPPLPTSVQPISITKTLLIVPTKNERDPPFFTRKLRIKFQNVLRNTTQVITVLWSNTTQIVITHICVISILVSGKKKNIPRYYIYIYQYQYLRIFILPETGACDINQAKYFI